MSEFTSVFDLAGEDAEQQESLRAMAVAKQAANDVQFYLFQAQDHADFGHRVALQEDNLMAAAAEGGISVHALVADYTREFGLVMEAKTAAADDERSKGFKQIMDDIRANSDEPGDGFDAEGNPAPNGIDLTRKAEKNVWGTEKSDINADEFCPDCERETRNGAYQHYDNCPRHPKNRKTAAPRPQQCPTCNGARAVPAQGHESYHEVSNGQVRCPGCAGHGVVQPSSLYPGVDNPNELTTKERWGDSGDYYGSDPGDEQDRWYRDSAKHLASIKQALEEGQDPLTWLEQEAAGEGQAEKPSEAGIEALKEAAAARPFERKAERTPQVHTFGSTQEAYDASQTHHNIKDGDVLHVPSEGITGFLNEAWPVALHHNGEGRPGEFHGMHPDADPQDVFGGGPTGKQYGLKDYSDTLALAKSVHEGMGKQGATRPF